jgi:hypothetical protein
MSPENLDRFILNDIIFLNRLRKSCKILKTNDQSNYEKNFVLWIIPIFPIKLFLLDHKNQAEIIFLHFNAIRSAPIT